MIKIEKKENKPLLEREEVYAIFSGQITPSIQSVQEELSTLLKKDKNLIVVKKIFSKFGKQEADILAYAYNSEESLEKFEPKKKEKKAKTEDKK